MRRRYWMVLPLLLLALPGCRRASDEAPLPADPILSPIDVEVVNNHAVPVEIFISGAGINHRLGTVHPGMSAHYQIPPGMVGNGALEFQAWSRSGRQPYRSGPILLSPGAIVDFVVGQVLFNSTATIRE